MADGGVVEERRAARSVSLVTRLKDAVCSCFGLMSAGVEAC